MLPHQKIHLFFLSFVVLSMLVGCDHFDKAVFSNPAAIISSEQQAISSAMSETAGELPPTEMPSEEVNWDEPAKPQRDTSSAYWALRDAFPLPDFQELSISKELEQMLENFFRENPDIIEQVEASRKWLGLNVVLTDVTGDHQPEVLIQRFTNYGASDQTGGLVSVYDLATAQHLGDLWTNDPWCENMGWYEGLHKENTSFLIIDYIFFRTYDETEMSTELDHVCYILWEINCDGTHLTKFPLWLFMNTTWFKPTGIERTECSLIDPSYELAVGFSKDPYSWYETVKSISREGCDPVIRDSISQIRPVETIYKKYAYIDDDGLKKK